MKLSELVGVILVLLIASLAWVLLGTVNAVRSDLLSTALGKAVGELWGQPLTQQAPQFSVRVPGRDQPRLWRPSRHQVTAELALEQRKKGLLWYPTYTVRFAGEYAVTNTDAVAQRVRVHFPLPSASATYEQFAVTLDGAPWAVAFDPQQGIRELLDLPAGATRTLTVRYQTRGLAEWRYLLTPPGDVGRVNQLQATVTTNFDAVDFPEGSLSPMTRTAIDGGQRLEWTAQELITQQPIAITLPQKLNPGPLAAKMSFYAPISLLFFFVVLGTVAILRRIPIHPMHYLFVAAGFFAFHLLFAYLVDLIDIHLAFLIATLVSVGLVVSYLKAALGPTFPWPIAALGQCGYLVLFSYSFFLQGMTGLTLTIGAVVTLAVLMRLTVALDWHAVFGAPPTPVGHTAVNKSV